MEYAANGDMFSYLRKKTLTESQIRWWFGQILHGFLYMHGMGVVHRDIKCENILLTGNMNVRITDFGFARFVGTGRNPAASTVCGTMAYTAPEILANAQPYDPVLADTWAVGVVLFMMCNNVAPFRDKRKEDMYRKQVSGAVGPGLGNSHRGRQGSRIRSAGVIGFYHLLAPDIFTPLTVKLCRVIFTLL